MGIWAWILLFAAAAALATVAQALVFSRERPVIDDWVYLAGGALVGGFTGHAWYALGPTFDGLNVVPAFVGLLLGAAIVEAVYRFVLRPRRTA